MKRKRLLQSFLAMVVLTAVSLFVTGVTACLEPTLLASTVFDPVSGDALSLGGLVCTGSSEVGALATATNYVCAQPCTGKSLEFVEGSSGANSSQPLPAAFQCCAMNELSSFVYCIGGISEFGSRAPALIYRFNSTSRQWQDPVFIDASLAHRSGHSCAFSLGTFYVFGGVDYTGKPVATPFFALDATSNVVTTTGFANIPAPRVGSSLVTLPFNDLLLLFGSGINSAEPQPAQVFNLVSQSWSTLPTTYPTTINSPKVLDGASCTSWASPHNPTGGVFCYGGRDASFAPIPNLSFLNLSSNTWNNLGSPPTASGAGAGTFGASMSLLDGGAVVVVKSGGVAGAEGVAAYTSLSAQCTGLDANAGSGNYYGVPPLGPATCGTTSSAAACPEVAGSGIVIASAMANPKAQTAPFVGSGWITPPSGGFPIYNASTLPRVRPSSVPRVTSTDVIVTASGAPATVVTAAGAEASGSVNGTTLALAIVIPMFVLLGCGAGVWLRRRRSDRISGAQTDEDTATVAVGASTSDGIVNQFALLQHSGGFPSPGREAGPGRVSISGTTVNSAERDLVVAGAASAKGIGAISTSAIVGSATVVIGAIGSQRALHNDFQPSTHSSDAAQATNFSAPFPSTAALAGSIGIGVHESNSNGGQYVMYEISPATVDSVNFSDAAIIDGSAPVLATAVNLIQTEKRSASPKEAPDLKSSVKLPTVTKDLTVTGLAGLATGFQVGETLSRDAAHKSPVLGGPDNLATIVPARTIETKENSNNDEVKTPSSIAEVAVLAVAPASDVPVTRDSLVVTEIDSIATIAAAVGNVDFLTILSNSTGHLDEKIVKTDAAIVQEAATEASAATVTALANSHRGKTSFLKFFKPATIQGIEKVAGEPTISVANTVDASAFVSVLPVSSMRHLKSLDPKGAATSPLPETVGTKKKSTDAIAATFSQASYVLGKEAVIPQMIHSFVEGKSGSETITEKAIDLDDKVVHNLEGLPYADNDGAQQQYSKVFVLDSVPQLDIEESKESVVNVTATNGVFAIEVVTKLNPVLKTMGTTKQMTVNQDDSISMARDVLNPESTAQALAFSSSVNAPGRSLDLNEGILTNVDEGEFPIYQPIITVLEESVATEDGASVTSDLVADTKMEPHKPFRTVKTATMDASGYFGVTIAEVDVISVPKDEEGGKVFESSAFERLYCSDNCTCTYDHSGITC
ncbi:hypothetical protein BC830DRAFT_848070 [Chytriomyces sp. MP71]|nr:hypothetical protein BC830DRAFT_848070 [Chytriomyces sp. MP71]